MNASKRYYNNHNTSFQVSPSKWTILFPLKNLSYGFPTVGLPIHIVKVFLLAIPGFDNTRHRALLPRNHEVTTGHTRFGRKIAARIFVAGAFSSYPIPIPLVLNSIYAPYYIHWSG